MNKTKRNICINGFILEEIVHNPMGYKHLRIRYQEQIHVKCYLLPTSIIGNR